MTPIDVHNGGPSEIVFVYPTTGPHHRAAINDTHKFVPCRVLEIVNTQPQYLWTTDCPLKCPVETLFDYPQALTSRDRGVLDVARRHIRERRPRVVFTTRYDLPIARAIAKEARSSGAASILMTDSTAIDHRRFRVKESFKRHLLRGTYDAAMVAGSRSHDYAISLGFEAGQLWPCVDVVDNDYFSEAGARALDTEERTRAALSLPEKYFLAIGRHAPEKNFAALLRAFAEFSIGASDYALVMGGAGPMSGELKALASSLGIENRVVFAGWIPYSRLPAYYSLARAVVLPSTSEPWGLVVNEAMSCGTPVIASRRCGCVPELVARDVSGFTFDPDSPASLAELLQFVASDKFDRSAMSAQARIKVLPYSLRARSLAILGIVRSLCG